MLKQLVMSLAVAATFGTVTVANSAQNEWTFTRDIAVAAARQVGRELRLARHRSE